MSNAGPPPAGGADSIPNDEPSGFRRQFAAAIAAVRRLAGAHIDLARAEAAEIAGEIGRLAMLAGVAVGALFLLGMLLPIGLLLFLGDALLGSMGWGVLLGSLMLVDVAVIAVLVAVGATGSSLGRDLLVALAIGASVSIVLLLTVAGARVGVALGLFVALVAWPALAGYGLSRRGVDTDALKARFYPKQTIETTKETIEWVREQTPLGRKS